MSGHHGHQSRFSDARSGKNTHTLAFANREKSIDGFNAEVDFPLDAVTELRRRRRAFNKIRFAAFNQRAFAVDCLAKGVDDTAQP